MRTGRDSQMTEAVVDIPEVYRRVRRSLHACSKNGTKGSLLTQLVPIQQSSESARLARRIVFFFSSSKHLCKVL
jgi:hypothetical protein